MGTKADHDLWGQAIAIESQYGDRGPEVLAQRIVELREAGELAEAEFWSQVAACLNDLHAIRLDVHSTKARPTRSVSPGRQRPTSTFPEGSGVGHS